MRGDHEINRSAMDHLSVALTVLYYIVYPIFYLLGLLLSILAIITAPLLHLGHYLLYALSYPIHFLGKFEVALSNLKLGPANH